MGPGAGACHSLDASVLALNKLYMPVQVIGARRAFRLLYKELAEVVTVDDGHYRTFDFRGWLEASAARVLQPRAGADDEFVRAVRFTIQVPRVVRLLDYDRLPRPKVKFNRRNIFARDGHCCQYCGRRFHAEKLSLDHVTPRCRGGRTTWENIVVACLPCNVRKGGRTPREANMRLLRDPARPKTSPGLGPKLEHRKYQSWKVFLDHASWPVEQA